MQTTRLWAVGTAMALALAPPLFARERPDPAQAEAVTTVTDLPTALEQAYERNPALLAERSRLKATDEQVAQARSQYGPQLNITGSYGYNYTKYETSNFLGQPLTETSRGWSGTVSAILDQPVFTFGRLAWNERQALGNVDFQRERLRLIEMQTIRDTIEGYLGVRRDSAQLGIAQENLALLDRQFSENSERFVYREVTRNDLDQVTTRLEQARATLESARGALGRSEARFVQVIGANAGELAVLPDLPGLPQTLEDALVAAETLSPVIRAAQAREKISHSALNGARADLLPSVSTRGVATYGRVSNLDPSRYQQELRGDVTVTVPLWDSRRNYSRIREAKDANDADWRLIDQAFRDVRADVTGNWAQLNASRAAIRRLEAAVAAAQSTYDSSVIQQRAGARSTSDVLDLARDLLNAKASLLNARSDEYLARAALLLAMGKLGLGDLDPNAELYDPEKHYYKVDDSGDTPPFNYIPATLDRNFALPKPVERDPRETAPPVQPSEPLEPEPTEAP